MGALAACAAYVVVAIIFASHVLRFEDRWSENEVGGLDVDSKKNKEVEDAHSPDFVRDLFKTRSQSQNDGVGAGSKGREIQDDPKTQYTFLPIFQKIDWRMGIGEDRQGGRAGDGPLTRHSLSSTRQRNGCSEPHCWVFEDTDR